MSDEKNLKNRIKSYLVKKERERKIQGINSK